MLLYPKTLLPLDRAWRKLKNGGRVTFLQWCDYFHCIIGNLSGFDSSEASPIYTAAFLTLWICCFAIVGGGPYIRPGVLVTVSWMTLGRQFALAQPALCSLYYSLRLISTKAINPGSLRRLWPVHYLIGWIGDHIPTVFGNKMQHINIPVCPYPSVRPTMLNTMSRKPILFHPKSAQKVLLEIRTFCGTPISLLTKTQHLIQTHFRSTKYLIYHFVVVYSHGELLHNIQDRCLHFGAIPPGTCSSTVWVRSSHSSYSVD